MHQYLSYQSHLQLVPSQTETQKLDDFSVLCTDLEPSLQFRDDLIEVMSQNLANATDFCQDTLFGN